MGFLKKKSATKLSGGDGVLLLPTGKSGMMSPTASRASPVSFTASKASNGECRDDASTATGARAASRCRSDSDSAANPFTPPLDHRRGGSVSSIVSTSSPSKNVQATQGPVATKSQLSPLEEVLPARPSFSAPAKVVKSKGSQHAAKGRPKPKSPSRSKPKSKSTKENKIFPSSRKYKSTPRPTVKNNWKRQDASSVSSDGSSDSSGDDDDSIGSDDSTTDSDDNGNAYTDDDGNTFTDDEGNTEIFEGESDSFVSIGANSTNIDEPDPDLSLDSCSTGETDDEDNGKEGFKSLKNMSSPRISDMFGKLRGWKAEKTEDDVCPTDSFAGFQKKSGHVGFLKKMDAFTAKNPDHQLLVHVTEHGNIEKLSIHEIAYIPTPNRPTEVVIKVECSTVNLQDCMIRRGKWYEMHNLPFIPGSDLVGTIHEIGIEASKSSTFKVGDRVAALVPSGGNAKYITIEYRNIIRVPPGVASERALCLSSTYVPAREALDLGRKMNTPFTGANILVIGGNGPSGLATIELALLEGACVFTTADERHHDHLTKLGAKCFAIDPAKWLPTLTGKMDVVLDSVCLDGYTSSSLALNSAGILVCTGMSAVYTQGAMPTLILKDARDVRAMYFKTRVKFLWYNAVYYDRMERFASAPNEYAQHFRYLCHLASKGTINPLVSTRAPLNLVASLQREIELGNTTYGICVCAPWTTQAASVTEGTAVPTTPP